jgi:hypothetical protein
MHEHDRFGTARSASSQRATQARGVDGAWGDGDGESTRRSEGAGFTTEPSPSRASCYVKLEPAFSGKEALLVKAVLIVAVFRLPLSTPLLP